ncbi:MAG: DUF87 domain-containing protein [Candidatus Verstraetearchaeota archaeon]|nr:DUF87 domain-containing protein [Candidatus Verstraetearchaeota archaeon]
MSSWVVGKIEGTAGTERFSMVVEREGVGRNDYVEVSHEGRVHLLQIKDVERVGGKVVAQCAVVGSPPKTPFVPGSEVLLASEGSLRRGLGIETGEDEGIYIGKLKNLDCKLWLPVKKMTRIFIVGKPGSGKSYTTGVIAEELIKKGIPLVVVDAHGEYSSLKIPSSSTSKEFGVEPRSYSESVIEFANLEFNPGADLDLSALDASEAEEIVAQMQCTIVNLRGLGVEEQCEIVLKLLTKLLEAVMAMRIRPFYLALDEAHLFAGRNRKDDPVARQVTEAVKRFAQEGRKFGANLIVMTQRPQLLDMTVRSLSATWIIHRLTDPNDVRIAVESGGLGKEWEADINWLEPGEAVITGDVVERVPLLVRVRSRETAHGAPGFNPLDFVTPEEREKMKRRMARMKERLGKGLPSKPGGPPQLPPTIPSLYLPIALDEKLLLDQLREDRSVDAAELLRYDITYMPALYVEAAVDSKRKDPDMQLKERIRRLVPVSHTFQSPDWRHESAYGVEAKEVLDLHQPSTACPREGEHAQVSPALLDPRGVENLKGSFRLFAVSKLTQTLQYHKELGEVSMPGESTESFRIRLREKVDALKKKMEVDIREKYRERLEEARSSIAAAKEDHASLERLVGSIRGELRDLEKERSKAEKEGRSTLKVSQQIQTREARLARLEQRMAKLRDEIGAMAKTEEALQESIKSDLERAAEGLEAALKAPLSILVFQPKAEEVEVEALQLVWVPHFEALYRLRFHEEERDLKMEWNGTNGTGRFGECSECSETITRFSPPMFCYSCGEVYCSEHLTECSACGRASCSEHSWICSECGKPFCCDELYRKCEVCGRALCPACELKCKDCIGEIFEKRYCKDHVRRCGVCNQTYCEEHYGRHMDNCKKCGMELCVLEQATCSICGGIFCEEHVAKCSACGEEACADHYWHCSACGKVFCKKELPYLCKVCGRPFCNLCTSVCSVCGERVCKEHLAKCPVCGRTVCPDCLIERKRFGIFKRAICSHCAQG